MDRLHAVGGVLFVVVLVGVVAAAVVGIGDLFGAWERAVAARAALEVARGERAVLEASAAAVRADTLLASTLPVVMLVVLSAAVLLLGALVVVLVARLDRERRVGDL